MEPRSFYKNAPSTSQALFIISTLAMTALSIYLTSHYYEVKFPTGVTGASLCDINSFFNCDVATNSPASNIAGIPISLFGIIISIFALFGYLFPSERVEGTNRVVLLINAVGCAGLFIYSLIALGALCPFCTVYYIFSFIAAYVIYKNSNLINFHILPISLYLAVAAFSGGIAYNYAKDKSSGQEKMSLALLKSYDDLATLGDPTEDSDYRMASATERFADAPLRITKFSDFECPACKALSDIFFKIANMPKYKGKITIQYFFYPLDMNCNASMKRPMHQNACKAAYLAACLPKKFSEIEHEIFANQSELSDTWLNKVAKREGVLECYKDEKIKKKVVDYISKASAFNIRSTPTFILNGKKIEGALPLLSITTLLDGILKRSK